MSRLTTHRVSRIFSVCALLALAGLAVSSVAAGRDPKTHQQVIIPDEDRFTPLALTIRAGDFVKWINTDTDDHTVVSDDVFNTAGNNGTDVVIPGTDSNGGQPGTFTLHFDHPGVFVYYCRFHSHLDEDNQPVAPGPKGGIQGTKDPTLCDPAGTDTCNFGTPMMGVITVIPGGDRD